MRLTALYEELRKENPKGMKKVAKKKRAVETKEPAVKGGMFEILDREADFETAIEVKENIEIPGEMVATKPKKK